MVRRVLYGTPGEHGVTLVELVMVLVLIGIVATFALPRLDVAHYQIDAGMQGVGTSCLAAQQLAVTRQHDVAIQFDVPRSLLRIHSDANNNGLIEPTEHVRVVSLGEGVRFGATGAPARPIGSGPVTFTKQWGGLPAVVFHRNGSASEAGGIYLTSARALRDPARQSDTRVLEIDRGTGRASWFRWKSGAWQRGF